MIACDVACTSSSSSPAPDGSTGDASTRDANDACPVQQPNVGDTCAVSISAACTYNQGCTGCVCGADARWVCTAPGCSGACPGTAPNDGDGCNHCCAPATPCPFVCDGGDQLTATCTNDKWHVTACTPIDSGVVDGGGSDTGVTDSGAGDTGGEGG
jgi:hypothetical protein